MRGLRWQGVGPLQLEEAMIVTGIVFCARCGKKHRAIKFKKLTHPIVFGKKEYGWWAPCPTNKQPILLNRTKL